MKDQGAIFMYRINWGEHIPDNATILKRHAMKSIRDELIGLYGNFIPAGNYLYSTKEVE